MLVLHIVRRSSQRITTGTRHCFLSFAHPRIRTRTMSSTVASSSSSVQTPSTINLQELLSVCHDLSEHAGRSIRRIFDSGDLGAIDKDPASASADNAARAKSGSNSGVDFGPISDPQTLADLESQRIIIGNLQRLYGTGLKIVGEEGELENSTGEQALVREARKDLLAGEKFPEELLQLDTKDLTLWVDPLDGTKEFTLGFVHYVTVLIGISYRGRALGGVVHVPFIGGSYTQKADPLNPNHKPRQRPEAAGVGQTIWGAEGVGVKGMDIAPLATIPSSRRFLTTTRSHFSPALKELLEKMQPQEIIRCGGAGSKGLLVLSGEADAYCYPQGGTKRWDTCAIDAFTKAVGGRFTDMYGDEIVYDANLPPENDKGLLATRRNHELYLVPKPDGKAAVGEEGKKANL